MARSGGVSPTKDRGRNRGCYNESKDAAEDRCSCDGCPVAIGGEKPKSCQDGECARHKSRDRRQISREGTVLPERSLKCLCTMWIEQDRDC